MCITHLIIPEIIYSRYCYCYHLTDERTDMQRRPCQEHTTSKRQCWDLIPDLWLQLFNPQMSDKCKTRIHNFFPHFRSLDWFTYFVPPYFLHQCYELNVCAPPLPLFICWNSVPPSDGIRRWSFWELIRSN